MEFVIFFVSNLERNVTLTVLCVPRIVKFEDHFKCYLGWDEQFPSSYQLNLPYMSYPTACGASECKCEFEIIVKVSLIISDSPPKT